ncbi:MAG: NAD(P)-dependent malic enzyme [Bacillota bacterium]
MDLKKESLKIHALYKGKIAIQPKMKIENAHDLSILYTPGVAEVSQQIYENQSKAYTYTNKGNSVAIVTDGSAVLGLGNIGSHAALPVMEGKSALFKKFANIDAYPLCLSTKDPDEIINIVKALAPSFGGINLEDISVPNCVKIQETLDNELDIPVFHDDQDGTAIVTAAALINALKLVNKYKESINIVLAGTGAAGSSIAKLLHHIGVRKIYAYNKSGVISQKHYHAYDIVLQRLLDDNIILSSDTSSLDELLVDSDVFIGVSAGDILTPSMIGGMNSQPIIFAMANPTPEINPTVAKESGAFIVGTGRSDYPNQINNVLAFPGIFKGALQYRVSSITVDMKVRAAYAIANIINDKELANDYIIPSVFDERVVKAVSDSIKKRED